MTAERPIIVAGCAVLHTLADDFAIEGFVISDRSLREGVLVDALLRRARIEGGNLLALLTQLAP